ncbi:MAG: GAF domain-containing SpoIIE family protein phosphatase, partial [Nocardioides sp.]
QRFPGASGLPSPEAEQRATPLSHSICQHVVTSAAPLVIEDTQADERVRTNGAVVELGVSAYAGVPLTDDRGNVLGSLCALDVVPRRWTAGQLQDLEDLAADCRTELRLRLSRLEATRERGRRDHTEERLQQEVRRARDLLEIAASLNETRSISMIRGRLTKLAGAFPCCTAVMLHLAGQLGDDLPAAVAQSADTRSLVNDDDVVCVPVIGSQDLLGVVELRFERSHRLDSTERDMVAALSSYLAQAVERALLIEHRSSVAHQLQAAMLTTLPHVPGLPMATCYVPADAEQWVGGDWYDAIVLPDPAPPHDLVVAVTVGDVIGHDIPAAAVMGQARAMLRQAAFDLPGAGPAAILTHFEEACEALHVSAKGTAVMGLLRRHSESQEWELTWTSAGHPPPLLALPDGTVKRLELSAREQGVVFGIRDVYDAPRVDSHLDLPRGSTLLLYSDGLVEVPGQDVDAIMDELGDVLLERHEQGPQAVVDAVSMSFGSGSDDVVALAIQVPTH